MIAAWLWQHRLPVGALLFVVAAWVLVWVFAPPRVRRRPSPRPRGWQGGHRRDPNPTVDLTGVIQRIRNDGGAR